jgi:hypothetical protein
MINDKFYQHMTAAQRDVIDTCIAEVERNLIDAVAKARAAHNALTKLPTLNEEGLPVLHGCNVRMSNLVDHYMTIARACWSRLSMINQPKADEIWLANTDLWKF